MEKKLRTTENFMELYNKNLSDSQKALLLDTIAIIFNKYE